MTEYFDHCGAGDHQISLHQRALQYILEEFQSNPDITDIDYGSELDSDWKKKVVQAMFDKSPVKMRMYGSAKEVLENLKIYDNCPGIHRYFSLDLVPYFSTPMIYENLNGQKFICKSDLFVMLQSMVKRSIPLETSLVLTIMSFFLKSKETLLKNVEFVPFDRKVFDEISKEILVVDKELYKIAKNDKFYRKFVQQLPKLGFEEMFVRLKSYIPNNWSYMESERVKTLLWNFENASKVFHVFDPKSVANTRAFTFVQARVIIEHLDKIIKKRPEMFLPNSGKGPITVRLFEDGDKKFVMKAELFNALKIEYSDPDHILDTMLFEDVSEVYKDNQSNIEFIRYPIQRAKHKAAPVNRRRLEEFCYLAIDALLEWLKHLIHGLRIFERHSNWSDLQLMFDGVGKIYMSEHKNPYFLTIRDTIESCKKDVIKPKTIRNAKPDGFTVQNLKNELIYLGLHLIFPDIQDHTEVVYAHVDKVKKEKFLRTCDLIDALEYCQSICFFERLPKYKKFLHNQGGCARVPGLKCELCNEKKKDSQKVESPPKTSSIKSNLPVQEINGVGSNKPVNNAKALAPSETHKGDLKAKELEEVKLKIASLEAQLASQAEKSSKIESDLSTKPQENEELRVSNIKLQAEDEANKGKISQLIDKLSIKGNGHESAICLN